MADLLLNVKRELSVPTVYVLVCIACKCRSPEYTSITLRIGMNPCETFLTETGIVLCDSSLHMKEPYVWFNPIGRFSINHLNCSHVYRIKTNRAGYLGSEFSDPEPPQQIHDLWHTFPIDWGETTKTVKNKIIELRSKWKEKKTKITGR